MSQRVFKRSQLIIAALLAVVLVFSQAGIAYASVSPQEFCEDNNGGWSGANSATGVCTFAPGSELALDACSSNLYAYKRSYNASTLTGESCVQTVFGYGEGDCSDLALGSDDGDEITPCHGTSGSGATFGPGACSGNCVVSSSLPKDAANHLPPGALQTLYVQVRDSDGNPSNDTYTVCLANPDRTLVTLYRFVSGAWVPLAISTSDPVCATVTGDGAFYLAPTFSLAISQI